MHEKSYIDHVFSLWLFIIVLYIYPIILQLYSIFCPESMSHKNNIFQWKEHWLRNRSLKCQPSTSFCECLYTINKLNNILSFYIGNETNFFYLFMKGVFFEIFWHSKTAWIWFLFQQNQFYLCVSNSVYAYTVVDILKYCTHPQFYIFFVISDT